MIRKAIIVVLTLGVIATAAVWLASHREPVVFHIPDTDQWEVGLAVLGGRCLGLCIDQTAASHLAHSHRSAWPRRSFHIKSLRHPIAGSWLSVGFPAWLPLLSFAAYPTLAFISGPLRRYRRRKRGLCVKCGYNLTGLPEPRCPECGEQVKDAEA